MLAPESKLSETDETAIVDEAIRSRKSVRAFLPRPGRRGDHTRHPRTRGARPVRHQHAALEGLRPDGRNQGRVADAILNSGIRAEKAVWDEYKYYPDQFFEPYLSRRRKVGFDLYSLLGIGRRDVDLMRAQHDRNFVFFDAPVGMIFTIDRRLNKGSWVDYGMFLQNIMVAARARGLHTCPQAAFAPYHHQIRPVLGIPDEEAVVCGMAIGYEDATKPENSLITERAPLDEWVTFKR